MKHKLAPNVEKTIKRCYQYSREQKSVLVEVCSCSGKFLCCPDFSLDYVLNVPVFLWQFISEEIAEKFLALKVRFLNSTLCLEADRRNQVLDVSEIPQVEDECANPAFLQNDDVTTSEDIEMDDIAILSDNDNDNQNESVQCLGDISASSTDNHEQNRLATERRIGNCLGGHSAPSTSSSEENPLLQLTPEVRVGNLPKKVYKVQCMSLSRAFLC